MEQTQEQIMEDYAYWKVLEDELGWKVIGFTYRDGATYADGQNTIHVPNWARDAIVWRLRSWKP